MDFLSVIYFTSIPLALDQAQITLLHAHSTQALGQATHIPTSPPVAHTCQLSVKKYNTWTRWLRYGDRSSVSTFDWGYKDLEISKETFLRFKYCSPPHCNQKPLYPNKKVKDLIISSTLDLRFLILRWLIFFILQLRVELTYPLCPRIPAWVPLHASIKVMVLRKCKRICILWTVQGHNNGVLSKCASGHKSVLLQSTLHFSWITLPWSHDHMPPRQATSAQGPTTHHIPQCYTTWPHEQAATPYKPTPCGGPPSLCRHALSHVYRATTRTPRPKAPCWAPHPHPLEYLPLSVLIYGRVHRARDAEPSVLAHRWLGQSYVRHATSRARSSHALLARQPRRPHAYSVTWRVPYRAMAIMARPPR